MPPLATPPLVALQTEMNVIRRASNTCTNLRHELHDVVMKFMTCDINRMGCSREADPLIGTPRATHDSGGERSNTGD